MIITFYFRVLQVMASRKRTSPGPHCKDADILIEGLMGSKVCNLNYDFSTGVLYELNQYRKANNVNWEDFYGWIQALTEGKSLN